MISRPSPKRLAQLAAVVIAATAVTMLGVRYVALLAQAEQFVADVRIASMLAPEPQDPNVVIVAINEDTLTRFPYRSPIDREFLASLLTAIEARGPRAIAVDLLFDQPTEPAKDVALHDVLAKATVPLVVSYTDDPQIVTPAQKKFLDAFVPAEARGRAELVVNPIDGAVRSISPGYRQSDGSYVRSLAREVAHKVGVETAEAAQEIVWRGPPDRDTPPFRTFPAHFAATLPAAWFAGKIVLVGQTVSLTDRHRTPFAASYTGKGSTLAGVEVLAHAVAQLIEGKTAAPLGLPLEVLLVASVALIGLLLGIVERGLGLRIGVAVLLLALLWVVGFAAFYYARAIVPLIEPTLAFVLAAAAGGMLTGQEARRQRAFIQAAFSRYLSPQLVKQLIQAPQRLELGGEMRDMTIMFCDIRSFAAIAERFDARGLTRFINRFLTPMSDVILAQGGTIDKYMGDAIMAFWNAPLDDPAHAVRACHAALAMRAELVRLNDDWRREWRAQGESHADIRIGIGLNTGACLVGNLGSDQRFDYSVLGDDVNLASRLEGQSSTYGVDIVVGEATVTHAPGLPFLELDLIRVKGKARPVRIYALLGDERVAETAAFAALRADHDAMLAAYRERRWQAALDQVETCRAQAPPAMLGCYALYQKRCADCAADPPPADWDAVFVALTK
jgi:class 3 adenylate cyclase/CHASE2 domain-containing sensor protein